MHSPYPPSATIRGLRWLTEPVLYPHSFGDVWTCTWTDDGYVYSASDDTRGIADVCNSNLAINRIAGVPPHHIATTINPMDDYGRLGQREGQDTWKANGLVSVDGALYLAVSQHSGAYDYPDNVQRVYDATIVKSLDHGRTWSSKPEAGRAMFPGPRFATPFFVQFGQDYAGAFDEYVYAVSCGGAWNNGNYMTLGRVRRDRLGLLDAADWEYMVGVDEENVPSYTREYARRPLAIFAHRGYTSMTGIQYIPAVDMRILFIIMLATTMLPPIITVIPTYKIFSIVGLIYTYWPWMLWGLASSPFLSFLFRQFFAAIPLDLEDAAIIDGCGYLRIFWQVMLPLSTAVLATAAIFSFQWVWGDWFTPLLFLNSDNTTLSVAISTGYVDFRGFPLTNVLSAGILIYTLPVLILFFTAQRYFVQGIVTSGLKG